MIMIEVTKVIMSTNIKGKSDIMKPKNIRMMIDNYEIETSDDFVEDANTALSGN